MAAKANDGLAVGALVSGTWFGSSHGYVEREECVSMQADGCPPASHRRYISGEINIPVPQTHGDEVLAASEQ